MQVDKPLKRIPPARWAGDITKAVNTNKINFDGNQFNSTQTPNGTNVTFRSEKELVPWLCKVNAENKNLEIYLPEYSNSSTYKYVLKDTIEQSRDPAAAIQLTQIGNLDWWKTTFFITPSTTYYVVFFETLINQNLFQILSEEDLDSDDFAVPLCHVTSNFNILQIQRGLIHVYGDGGGGGGGFLNHQFRLIKTSETEASTWGYVIRGGNIVHYINETINFSLSSCFWLQFDETGEAIEHSPGKRIWGGSQFPTGWYDVVPLYSFTTAGNFATLRYHQTNDILIECPDHRSIERVTNLSCNGVKQLQLIGYANPDGHLVTPNEYSYFCFQQGPFNTCPEPLRWTTLGTIIDESIGSIVDGIDWENIFGTYGPDDPEDCHNNLDCLQGGKLADGEEGAEYYHLTECEYDAIGDVVGNSCRIEHNKLSAKDGGDGANWYHLGTCEHDALTAIVNVGDDCVVEHNLISGKQGGLPSDSEGNEDEYYHLSQCAYEALNSIVGPECQVEHNVLASIQGGDESERYHLSQCQRDALQYAIDGVVDGECKISHHNLVDLQGGDAGQFQYYHLTQAELNSLDQFAFDSELETLNIGANSLLTQGGIQINTDNAVQSFGTDGDATIKYDGTDLVINPKEVGSGKLSVLGNTDIESDLVVGSDLEVSGLSLFKGDVDIENNIVSAKTFIGGLNQPYQSLSNKGSNNAGVTISNYAFDFTGGSSYISFDNEAMPVIDARSVSMWLWLTAPDPTATTYPWSSNYQTRFSVSFAPSTGRLRLLHGSTIAALNATDMDYTGRWTHVVAITEGNDTDRVVWLYRDTVEHTATSTGTAAGTQKKIGAFNSGGVGHFNGYVDNVVEFDRKLTVAEIQQIFNAGRESYCPITDYVDQYTGKDYAGTSSAPTAFYNMQQLSKSNLVPYTGATKAVNLGANNLTVDTNVLFVDATNDKVGIGTITPDEKLHVDGNIFLNTDSQKLLLGTTKDASIYYDGTDLVINPKEVGTGDLSVLGNIKTANSVEALDGVILQSPDNTKWKITISNDGNLETESI